jgi:hypothetical protein
MSPFAYVTDPAGPVPRLPFDKDKGDGVDYNPARDMSEVIDGSILRMRFYFEDKGTRDGDSNK